MPAYISAIATSVPEHIISQKETAQFMMKHLPLTEEERHLVEVIYRASGIQTRHSVISDFQKKSQEFTFFPKNDELEPFPTVHDRMELYQQEAIKLGTKASLEVLKKSKTSTSTITHLVTISCTGMYAPGLDIELIQALGLATSTERTAINFMGCYAAFNGIKMARQIVENHPDAKVLVVCVELCSIHLQKMTDEDSLLSNALFADGAAAVLIEGKKREMLQLEVVSQFSDLALQGKEEMKWNISNHGFLMKLSAQVPEQIEKGISALTHNLLKKLELTISDIDFFAIHPGGKRILEVIEKQLGMDKEDNRVAYDVLKQYGNMSSPTVLFVLQQTLASLDKSDSGKKILSFAFGPGLTLESLLYRIA